MRMRAGVRRTVTISVAILLLIARPTAEAEAQGAIPSRAKAAAERHFISASYMTRAWSLPPADSGILNLAVSAGGVPVVPVNGELFLPTLGGWLTTPGLLRFASAAYDADDALISCVTDAKGHIRVIRTTPGHRTATLGDLPAGRHVVADAGGGQVLVLSHVRSGDWVLSILASGRNPAELIRTRSRIWAATPVNASNVLVALGGQMLLLSRGASTKVLGSLSSPVDGLAVGPDGTVFMSTRAGIFRWIQFDQMGIVALGVHGPLIERAGSLFVLDRSRNRVLMLRPRGA